MKFLSFVATAPLLVSAYVLPDQEVFAQIAVHDNHHDKSTWSLGSIYHSVKDEVKHASHRVKDQAKSAKQVVHNTVDAAFEAASHDFEPSLNEEGFDGQSWLDDTLDRFLPGRDGHRDHPPHDKPPHHGPPHDGPPRHGPRPPHGPPHHGPPHHGRGHRRGHHSNSTVYELIANSKYTTKFAKLLNDYPDLVEKLNSTKANYTVFAPTDAALERAAKHHHGDKKPSKEFLKMILEYHISDHFYPAGRVLHSYTIPTLLESDELAEKPLPQRLTVKFTLRGLTLNYYSRIEAVDIFGSNGVIHGVGSVLVPPPRALQIIDRLPSEFSTLELALTKTGLLEEIASHPVKGGTLFGPSNSAFARLGFRANAFLFSPHGLKYLKALVKYHVVPKTTLYSDALYISTEDYNELQRVQDRRPLHLDLPTLLEDHSVSVDVKRTGPFITILLNGFTSASGNGVARDGVIQVVNKVLIPPKEGGDDEREGAEGRDDDGDGEISVEELKARLAGSVE